MIGAARYRLARAARLGLLALGLGGLAAPVAGQQQASRPAEEAPRDTTPKTPAQRVQERLRTLRPVAAPDTVLPDSLRADSLKAAKARAGGAGAQAASGGSGIQRDALMTALAQLTGFVATEYAGDEAAFRADSGQLELLRKAAVVREGQLLQADSLVRYNEQTGSACGFGKPTITGASLDAPITADSVCYNIHSQRGIAANAETSISQGANWKIRGQLMTVGDTVFGHNAIFTDCDIPWPHTHYFFGAKETKAVRDNVLVAKNVTLNFADVPVFWLPFMVQSLSRGRRSGILMPRFGINDIARNSTRYSRRIEDVGFYWAINDYMGAEVAMDWMANNYTALRGSLDFNVVRSFLNGSLTFRRYFPAEGGNQFTLSAQSNWQPDERTRLGMSANYSTSASFVRRRTLDTRELTRSIATTFNLNRQFNWGSLTLGATRNQFLTDGTVRMTLPSFGLNLSSVTLFRAEPGEEKWYSNATWTGTIDGRIESNMVGDSNRTSAQSRRNANSNFSSSFTLGKLGLSQAVRWSDSRIDARAVRPLQKDTLLHLPGSTEQRANWSMGINFQQNLIGTTTTLTPSLSLNGEFLNDSVTDGRMVASPTRLDFNASLQTALYGFFPGVGPFSRIRHRLTPSVSYTYSPAPTASALQQRVFSSFATDSLGRGGIRERNVLTFGIAQTFEGKRRPRAEPAPESGAPGGEPSPAGDSTAAPLAADTATSDSAGGPRRLPQGEAPVILLSLTTDAVVYDFVAAREGKGIQTTSISTSIQSDLFRNLQLRFTHELWRPVKEATEGQSATSQAVQQREFAPFLSSLNASLSLNSDSWLFRALGLGRKQGASAQPSAAAAPQDQPAGAGTPFDRTRPENGMVGTRRRDPVGSAGGQMGSWNASLNYTLSRSRPGAAGLFDNQENQMVTGQFSFQPTENWTLNWSTGYNITVGGFTDHMLTLSRRLHDWDANFDFAKVQNGNLSFQFRVALRANPDIKLDYQQHDLGTLAGQPRF
ncbi:MAG: hypothetical protein FIB01_13615 [Gemmatimonadetes bacterium]|nr:hypothetical protein [Gemmatimonadota bacterium]